MHIYVPLYIFYVPLYIKQDYYCPIYERSYPKYMSLLMSKWNISGVTLTSLSLLSPDLFCCIQLVVTTVYTHIFTNSELLDDVSLQLCIEWFYVSAEATQAVYVQHPVALVDNFMIAVNPGCDRSLSI